MYPKEEEKRTARIANRLLLYPLILIISFIFATINRFTHLFCDITFETNWFILLHIVFSNLNGFLNAVVYGLSNQVKQHIKDLFKSNSKNEIELTN